MGMSFSNKMYNKIFNRREEGQPFLKYFTYEDFKDVQVEDFSLALNEEEIINGKFYFKNNFKKDCLVIFVHGFGGGHYSYTKEIMFLVDHNFKVLSYDNVGTCLSKGKAIKGFNESAKDLDEVLTYLSNDEKFKNLNIYLVGHSMGAYASGINLVLHDSIKKAVLISTPLSSEEAFVEQIPFKSIAKQFNKIEKTHYPKYASLNLIETINKTKSEVLLIHSKDDHIINFTNNFLYIKEKIKRNDVIFYSVDKKKHNPTYKDEAVKELDNLFKKLKKYKKIEDKIEFTKNYDFNKCCDLDEDVMNEIITFLNKQDFLSTINFSNSYDTFEFKLVE